MAETARDAHRTIVVGVDGSEESILALRYAERVAPVFDADILALYVWSYPLGYAPLAIEWNPEEDARTVLGDAVQDAYGEARPAGFRAETRAGDPARVLIDESASAELVVLGSRGHGGFIGLLIGAVSAQVTEHAKCPVLVVHDRGARR